jgi:hypothetical protein
MAITVAELVSSRHLSVNPKNTTATREYFAQSSDIGEDAGNINDAIANASPNVYLGLIKKNIRSEPKGSGFWHGTVEYGVLEGQAMAGGQALPPPAIPPAKPPELKSGDVLQDDYSFSTSGGTQHIVKSINTVGQGVILNRVAPATRRAINVSKDSVQGCDIIVPKFELTIRKRVAFVTIDYAIAIADCTGCINDRLWNLILPGDALFLGAEASYDGSANVDQSWLLTFKFLIARTKTNFNVGGDDTATQLIVPIKRGHDFLWLGYTDTLEGAVDGILLQLPWFYKIEQVYEERNFRDQLGF